jgi:hypothetical protein
MTDMEEEGKMRFVKIMLLWAFGLFNAAFHLIHFASVIQEGKIAIGRNF